MIFWLLTLITTLVLAETKPVVIGFNPAENSASIESNGKIFADYYKEKTGLPVKTFVSTDYTALIEAMRSGKVDFAFLPPFSLVKAEEMAKAKVLLKAVRKGKAVFYSAIIVRADKPYKTIEDLKGKNIAWVDPASASGFIFPKASLITRKKIDPDTFFHKQIFAGGHDAVVLSVFNGTVDAGATYVNDQKGEDGAWHLFLKDPADKKKIRMIYVSDAIPGETLSTTEKFAADHADIVAKTLKLMTEIGKDPVGRAIMVKLYNIEEMIPATSQEYQPVRDAAKTVKIDVK